MDNCLNAVGFVFDKVKTYIKKDKYCKYTNYYCQDCVFENNNDERVQCREPIPGKINPCNNCTNNTQYKICIFKLKKIHFISSSLDIAMGREDAWEQFKTNIIYQRNGNFVISVTKENNQSNSFYANLIKAKKCTCCDAVMLYFKYNIISLLSPYQEQTPSTNTNTNTNTNTQPDFPYSVACANLNSNITYNLKSCEYKNVRFFISGGYQFKNSLEYFNTCG